MSESKPKRLGWKLALFVLPFLIAGFVAFFLFPPPPPFEETPPIATADFPVEEQFHILRAELGIELAIDFPRERRFAFGTTSSSGMGVTRFISMGLNRAAGELTQASCELPRPGLILVAKHEDMKNNPMVSDQVFAPSPFEEHFRISWGPSSVYSGAGSLKKGTLSTPLVRIEVEDGAGGWLPMSSPIVPHKLDGRGFSVGRIFPRRKPDLAIRVTRDGETRVLTIPNPGYAPSFPTWTATPQPWKLSFGDCELEMRIEDTQPGLFGQQLPKPKFEKMPATQSKNAFFPAIESVSDETGNEARDFQTFAILPGTKTVRIDGTLVRTRNYRWEAADVIFFAEGTCRNSTKEADWKLLSPALTAGIHTIEWENAKPGLWLINLKIEGDAARTPWLRSQPIVLFLDGSTVQDGQINRTGSSYNEKLAEFRYSWTGDLKSGQKFRLGYPRRAVESPFSITIPVNSP